MTPTDWAPPSWSRIVDSERLQLAAVLSIGAVARLAHEARRAGAPDGVCILEYDEGDRRVRSAVDVLNDVSWIVTHILADHPQRALPVVSRIDAASDVREWRIAVDNQTRSVGHATFGTPALLRMVGTFLALGAVVRSAIGPDETLQIEHPKDDHAY